MRINSFTLLALIATFALALPARAAESITVRAVLIMASNKKAPADPKLAPFEAELQRSLPESSFKFVREGSATISDGGHATISLGSGDSVEVEVKKTAEGIQQKLRWVKGGLGGTFVQEPGVPVVLLRRAVGDAETPIVVVIAK